jgi:hypothetical protein
MRRKLILAAGLLVGLAGMGLTAPRADAAIWVRRGPVVVRPGPVVVRPGPVVVRPAPVFVRPAPLIRGRVTIVP